MIGLLFPPCTSREDTPTRRPPLLICISILLNFFRATDLFHSFRYQLYSDWYNSTGFVASDLCKSETERLFCITQFPPCHTENAYALYPCDDTCKSYRDICGDLSSFVCPSEEEPQVEYVHHENADYSIFDIYYNKAEAACYHQDYSIEPSKCLYSNFTCENGGYYHPECSKVCFLFLCDCRSVFVQKDMQE